MSPWSALLRVALSMGIAPHDFWRLSLAEWRTLAGGQGDVLGRTAFEELARQFPDERI